MSSNTGGYHNCAVKGGQLYCWGEGMDGALGNGSKNDSPTPVKVDMTGVMAGTTVTKVQTAYGSTCAVASGKAFCWGEWWVTGTGDYGYVPQQIGGLLAGKTVTDIAVLDTGACAIADGTPYCWGGDQYGQNGDGQVTRFNQDPVAVDTSGVLAGKQVTSIAGGYDTACAIADARAYCWGSNYSGELGNGTSHDSGVDQSSVPVAVGGDLANLDVTEIGIDWAECAVAGGKAYCWGWGSYLLGTKSTIPTP
jgi:alpha-tubulin suppressor-like RCC1 family protein